MRFVILLLLVASTTSTRAIAQCACPARDAVIIGHRGAGTSDGVSSENTIESANEAILEGADVIEVDARRTADGVVVLMHDAKVDRTTDGFGCLGEMTFEEVAALDAGGGARVPTLAEFLDEIRGRVHIEVKLEDADVCPADDAETLTDAVLADVVDAGAIDRVTLSSFSIDVGRRVVATHPAVAFALLTTRTRDVDRAVDEGSAAVHFEFASITDRAIRRARRAGLRFEVWTVNGATDLLEALEEGVDGVITDTVDEAVAAREAYCDSYLCPDELARRLVSCRVSPRASAPFGVVVALLFGCLVRRRVRRRVPAPPRAPLVIAGDFP